MPLSFRLINVSIGNVGTPLSPSSAVLISTCHRLELPAPQPALLALPGKKIHPGAPHSSHFTHARRTEQHKLPGASSAEGKRKSQHTQPLQQAQCWTELGRFLSARSAHNPWCPQVPALTPRWHWDSSVSSKALKELPRQFQSMPQSFGKTTVLQQTATFPLTQCSVDLLRKRADFIHKHQSHEH